MSDSNGFDSSTGKDSLGFTKGYYSKSTKIGIIADIQYADVEDGSNFDKSETRGYRQDLNFQVGQFILRTEVRCDFNIHGTKNFQNAVFHQKSENCDVLSLL